MVPTVFTIIFQQEKIDAETSLKKKLFFVKFCKKVEKHIG